MLSAEHRSPSVDDLEQDSFNVRDLLVWSTEDARAPHGAARGAARGGGAARPALRELRVDAVGVFYALSLVVLLGCAELLVPRHLETTGARLNVELQRALGGGWVAAADALSFPPRVWGLAPGLALALVPRTRALGSRIVLLQGVGCVLKWAGNVLFREPRPFWLSRRVAMYHCPQTYGFPSGHAMLLFLTCAPLVEAIWNAPRARAAAATALSPLYYGSPLSSPRQLGILQVTVNTVPAVPPVSELAPLPPLALDEAPPLPGAALAPLPSPFQLSPDAGNEEQVRARTQAHAQAVATATAAAGSGGCGCGCGYGCGCCASCQWWLLRPALSVGLALTFLACMVGRVYLGTHFVQDELMGLAMAWLELQLLTTDNVAVIADRVMLAASAGPEVGWSARAGPALARASLVGLAGLLAVWALALAVDLLAPEDPKEWLERAARDPTCGGEQGALPDPRGMAMSAYEGVAVVAAWVASMSLLCIDAEVEAAEAAPRTTAQHRAKRAPPTYGSIVALGHGSPRQTVRLAAAVSGHPHGSELVGSGARLQHGWEWQAVLATCSQFAAAVAMLELVPKPAGAALAVLSALYVFPSLFW
jgi:membrane-associated phospholipid phosphatase